MRAQRKEADPVQTVPAIDAAPVESVTPVSLNASHPVSAGDPPVSPALLLREQLAARLAAPEVGTTAGAADGAEVKLPMALRVATIVTLSVALWGGIALSATKLLT
jgi:hypothetical protein